MVTVRRPAVMRDVPIKLLGEEYVEGMVQSKRGRYAVLKGVTTKLLVEEFV